MLGRDKILRETRRRLIGPGLGKPGPSGTHADEIIEGRMSLAYMQGMLFPRAERSPADLGGDEAEDASDEDADDPLSMSNAMLPASMGMSLCIAPGSKVQITVDAAVYEQVEPREDAENPETARTLWGTATSTPALSIRAPAIPRKRAPGSRSR